MPLTLSQKSDIRRHLEYPSIGLDKTLHGSGSMGLNVGYRYWEEFGMLEFRMNNLPPFDEARIVGNYYGAVALVGPGPSAGDQVTATLSGGALGSPVNISVTAVAADTNTTLAQKIGAAAAQNSTLQAAGIIALAPYGELDTQVGVAQALAEVSFVSTGTFNLAVSSSGSTGAVVSAVPALPTPQATVGKNNGTAVVLNGYLPILDYLEGAIAGATQNLDTIQAGEWKARADEVKQRKALYREWQVMLANFLDVPLNPLSMRRWGGSGRVVI